MNVGREICINESKFCINESKCPRGMWAEKFVSMNQSVHEVCGQRKADLCIEFKSEKNSRLRRSLV